MPEEKATKKKRGRKPKNSPAATPVVEPTTLPEAVPSDNQPKVEEIKKPKKTIKDWFKKKPANKEEAPNQPKEPKKPSYNTEKYVDEVEAKYQGKKDKLSEQKKIKADKQALRRAEAETKRKEKLAKQEAQKQAKQQLKEKQEAERQARLDERNKKVQQKKAKVVAKKKKKQAENTKKEMSKLKTQLSSISQMSRINTIKKAEEKAEDQKQWLSVSNKQDLQLIDTKPSKQAEPSNPATQNKLTLEKLSAIKSKMKVGCTGCGYCMPCPQNINISGTFSAYNRHFANGNFAGFGEYIKNTALSKYAPASKCIGCGKCEQHCPQGIEIRKELMEAEKTLETPMYKTVSKVASVFKKQ